MINLAARRRCHEWVGGFPDFDVFRRCGDLFVHDFDVFRSLEDIYDNRAINQCLRSDWLAEKSVRYTRSPGDAFDRLYGKFRRRKDCHVGFGSATERKRGTGGKEEKEDVLRFCPRGKRGTFFDSVP